MKRQSTQLVMLDDGTEIEPIRIETALSRFPIHTLSKGEPVNIHLHNQGDAIHWQIAPNSNFGAPGPLAYKIDTLVVNKRIDEARAFGQAFPQVLRLGSLREIAEELGSETKTNDVKRALLQNASVFIMAKMEYVQRDGARKSLEANFTRYQVVLTGEDLPGERKADAVYIILNPIYFEIVSQARARPVDYKYLKGLKPLSQRFYELVSPSIYGAVNFNNFTNVRYSEFCSLAPATRQSEQWRVKKQLDPVITPHLASGYLAEVFYQPTVDKDGEPDWIISLKPGNLARGHAEAFSTKKPSRREIKAGDPRQPTLPFPLPPATRNEKPAAVEPPDNPETVELIEALTGQGINVGTARQLARTNPEECRRQLDYLPYRDEKRSKGAFLRRAIEEGFAPPDSFKDATALATAEQQRQDAVADRQARRIAEEGRRAAEVARVDQMLTQLETTDPAGFQAFSAYIAEEQRSAYKRYAKFGDTIKSKLFAQLETPEKRRELFQLWQAEQAQRTGKHGLRLPAEPHDIELKHLDPASTQRIIDETTAYNRQRPASEKELSAFDLVDQWLAHIRRADHKIADVDKSFVDFALERLYKNA